MKHMTQVVTNLIKQSHSNHQNACPYKQEANTVLYWDDQLLV